MVRSLFVSGFMMIASLISAQNHGEGTLFFNLGLSQGYMLNHKSRPLFADGYLGYFVSDQISIKGTCTQLIADRVELGVFNKYTGISFGAFRHYTKGIHDMSFGIQPGLALIKPNILACNYAPAIQATPSLMFTLQYTLFFSNIFHFYVAASENSSWFRGAPNGSINSSWFSITGGLGYHFRIKK